MLELVLEAVAFELAIGTAAGTMHPMRGAIGLLGISSFLISGLAACEAAKEGFNSSFKQSFAKSFGESCTQGAVREGAPEDKAKPLCECAATFLVANHDTSTLAKLGTSPTSPETHRITGAAIDACSAPVR